MPGGMNAILREYPMCVGNSVNRVNSAGQCFNGESDQAHDICIPGLLASVLTGLSFLINPPCHLHLL